MVKKMNTFKRNSLALGIASSLVLCVSGAAMAAEDKVLSVDIEKQKAGTSLMALAREAGVQITIPNRVGESIQLSALKGEYTLEQALQALLQGTGLIYQFSSEDVVLVKEPEEEAGADEPEKENEKHIDEEIIVTGSRLITDPGKMTRQMTIFDREEIERSGATRLDEFLRRLPQNVNAPSNIGSGFPGNEFFFDFGMGSNVFAGSSVNLRGLGSQYTLILINGRRPARGGQFGDIIDISNIPVERVERIEVLFDGAAAIYGADAVGGVVNIITNRQYEGTDVSLTYADTNDGGGKRYNLNIGHTFNWDSGSLTATLSYQSQDAIDGAQRDIALGQADQFSLPPSTPGNIAGRIGPTGQPVPLMWVRDIDGDGNTLNEDLDERLTGTVEVRVGRFGIIGFGPDGPIFGMRESTTRVDRGNPVISPLFTLLDPLPFNPADNGYRAVYQAQVPEYNGQPFGLYDVDDSGEPGEDLYVPFQGNALTPEDETYSVGLALDQQLAENLQLGLSLNYSITDKVSNRASAADEFGVDGSSLANPFEDRIRYAWVNEFPQESQVVDQSSVSLSGNLDWAINSDWSLVFGFGLSENKNNSDTINRLRNRPTRPDEPFSASLGDLMNGYAMVRTPGSPPERVELGSHFHDPFLSFDSAQELVDATVIPFQHTHNYGTSRDIDLTLQGTLFTLAAGDVRSSLTLAHNRQGQEIFDSNLLFVTDAFEDGDNEGSIDLTYDERYATTTNRVAGEIAVPLVSSDTALPFVENFLVSTSASYEKYSNVEDKGFNWATGFNWGINDWLTIRFNRTYNLKVPEAVRSARDPEYRRSPEYRVYIDPNRPFLDRGVRVFEPLWTIDGGSDHLKSERNYGTSLGFIFRPTFAEGLDIQLNISESHIHDQINASLVNTRFTARDLLPDNVEANPILSYADPDNNPAHDLTFVDSSGNVFSMQPGELIQDRRAYNVGNTFNRGADLEVRYDFRSDWGDWLLVWRHQYTDVNEIVQSDACNGDTCNGDTRGGEPRQVGEPIDIVGTINRQNFNRGGRGMVIPRNKGSFELNWGYRGLGVNLSTQYQQETSIIQVPQRENFLLRLDDPGQRVNIYREDTRPEQSVDMSLSYDFSNGDLFSVPDWLTSTRVSLTIDDLWRRERKVNIVYLRQEYERDRQALEVNRYGLNPRGRGFTLKVSSVF